MKRFLVVGAGVTGCSAALELAGQGNDVTILEASAAVGGKVLSYCCKATDSCARCGVCVAHDTVAKVIGHPRISILTGGQIQAAAALGTSLAVRGSAAHPRMRHALCTDCGACLAACPTRAISRYSRAGLTMYSVDFSRCLLHKGKRCTACAEACGFEAIESGVPGPGAARQAFDLSFDGVVVATGHETFDPSCKPRLGYGRIAGVMTGLEAEAALSREAALTRPDGIPAASVAFIQCVGSRDPSLCRNFCSAVCCAYALRMARILKSRQPDAAVTVYSIDLQNFDKEFTAFRGSIEAMGIQLVRGVPSIINRTADGRLELLIEDPRGNTAKSLHDAVVLSVGMSPAAGAGRTAELFGLEQDEFGFFSPGLPSVRAAGTCVEPQGIVESIASGRAAAATLLSIPAREASS